MRYYLFRSLPIYNDVIKPCREKRFSLHKINYSMRNDD